MLEGLIRNYARTAKLAVNEAGIVEYREKAVFIIDFNYSYTAEVESFRMQGKRIRNRNYQREAMLDRVTMKIMGDAACRKKFEEMNKLIVIKM